MDADANPEDDEVIHISTSSYSNGAKLQSTTLRNQFQLIEHRYKAKRGTPIHLPSGTRSAQASSKQNSATASRMQPQLLSPNSKHTALLPSSLNKIVRSTSKHIDQLNSEVPFTEQLTGGRTTIGDVVKKQKRNSMVEISSDEEDQRAHNRRRTPSFSLSAESLNKDLPVDVKDELTGMPISSVAKKGPVVSRMKRKNGTDVGTSGLNIPKKRRSNWDVRSTQIDQKHSDSKDDIPMRSSLEESTVSVGISIRSLPLVNIVWNDKRITSSPSKKQRISITNNNEIVFMSQGLVSNFEKKVPSGMIKTLEFYVGDSGGLHVILNDATEVTAVLSPSVTAIEFSHFIQCLDFDNISVTPFEKADWEKTLEKAALPVLSRSPTYGKKPTGLVSEHSVDGTPKEQVSLPAVASSTESDQTLFVYPFTGYGGITISKADEARLDDGEFLNDSIIDFYMKWILDQLESRDPELASQVHIFNSFFYKRLTQRNPNASKDENAYDRVKKWTSKINLFDKSYAFIPINENWHWYLAIVCNLKQMLPSSSGAIVATEVPADTEMKGEEAKTDAEEKEASALTLKSHSLGVHSNILQSNARDMNLSMVLDGQKETSSRSASPATPESIPGTFRRFNLRSGNGSDSTEESPSSPWIFLLDSLGNRHPKAFQCLQQYLQSEAKARMNVELDRDGCKPSSSYGKVPRQRNYCDCGVYLLHYVEVFLSDPRKYLTLLSEKRDTQQEWAPTEAHEKRQKIRQVIHSTAELYKSIKK